MEHPNSQHMKRLWAQRKASGFVGFNKGRKFGPHPIEHNQKISEALKRAENPRCFKKGQQAKEKHPLWKGGITPINQLLRGSAEYRQWREAVFRRDKWTCVWCGYRSRGRINGRSDIHADHIKSFAQFSGLRFTIDNGRT